MEGSGRLSDTDRARLVGFLQSLRFLLDRLVSREPPFVSPRMTRLLRNAWQELEREGRFEEAIRQVEFRDYDRALIEHGLYGRQLDLKLGVFEAAETAVAEDEGKFLRFYKRRKGLMGWALNAANVVLGSLGDGIPGVGAIKEFKDAAEAALDERASIGRRIRGTFGRLSRGRRKEALPPPDASLPT